MPSGGRLPAYSKVCSMAARPDHCEEPATMKWDCGCAKRREAIRKAVAVAKERMEAVIARAKGNG